MTDLEIFYKWHKTTIAKFSIKENWQVGAILDFAKYYHNEHLLKLDDYWEIRCKLIEQVEENNPCDPDITQKQIDAWNKYHDFIKAKGRR